MPLATRPPHVRPEEAMGPTGIDCRVVVIDDNRDAAELIAMLVQELGGESGPRTTEKADFVTCCQRPDVVLLDSVSRPGWVPHLSPHSQRARECRAHRRSDRLRSGHDKDASARAGSMHISPNPPIPRRYRSSSANVGRAVTIMERTPHLRVASRCADCYGRTSPRPRTSAAQNCVETV